MPRSSTGSKRSVAAGTRAFLFADLRGFTDFVERQGDDAAARLIRDYRALVRREVARATGAEVKTEGDSFYVVFDSAGAALDCAVAIQRRAATQSAKEPDRPLHVGIGLHAGDTVALERQFVGSAVNVAARLAAQAGAGEIVLSDTLRGLVRTSTSHELREMGELALKGVSEPVRAWTVEWQAAPEDRSTDRATGSGTDALPLLPTGALPAAPARGQMLCPAVIGREGDIERAGEMIAAAAAGRGQTLILGGEAGVGKSAFVREAVGRATPLGFRLLYGATLEPDRGLPYAPFLSAVRSGFRGLERDRLGRVLARAAPDLAHLFPELARTTRAETIDAPRVAYAFAGLFTTFSREAPVLLVIEDLHWADETSLGLLVYLARELRDVPVLMLATYRSDEMHRRHPLLRTLAALQRERLATEIALRRLDREQVRELIRLTFAERQPDVTITDGFLDAIYARSEGNPYFTEELLKSLVESGDVYYSPETGWDRKPIEQLQIPSSVREAVRERVAGLSDEARATAAVAAAIGLQFEFDVLRVARGIDESTLEAHLRELIDGQLVAELAGRDERYTFRHALSKEVVYDDLLVRERKRLHRAVAAALAASPATEPALLAHHLLAAGDAPAALPYLLAAADRAAAAGAPREAANHYARAIEIGLDDERLASAVERQAEAYQSFDIALSIRAAQEALALYRERDDRRGQSRMLRLISRGHFYETRPDEAARLATEAIDVLAGEECAELGRAIAHQSGLLMARRRHEECLPLADRALELGRRLDDHWTVANALITRGSALPAGEEAVAALREGIAVATRHGIGESVSRGYNNIALRLLRNAAPFAERAASIEEGLTLSRRLGLERAQTAYLLSQRAGLQYSMGDWDDALASGEMIEPGTAVSVWGLMLQVWIDGARDGPAAAQPAAERMATHLRSPDPTVATFTLIELAGAALRAGRIDEAREQLRSLREVGDDVRDKVGPGPAAWSLCYAAVRLDEPLLLALAEAAINLEEFGTDPLAAVSRARLKGARTALAGDAAAAATVAESSLATFEHMGFRAQWAEAVLEYATVLTARGHVLGPEWRPLLERVRAFAARPQVRAAWWAAEAERLMPAGG